MTWNTSPVIAYKSRALKGNGKRKCSRWLILEIIVLIFTIHTPNCYFNKRSARLDLKCDIPTTK